MSTKNVFMKIVAVMLILAMGVPMQALAQESQDDAPPPAAEGSFRPEELDQMLAPIALYPDSLLAQMLMAATYPLEVVEASRFLAANQNLKGDQLLDAAKAKDWDPSVKSLLQFSDVLAMMDQQLEWTTDLGNAFLSQQRDVMDSIQRLRANAQEAGNLKTTNEQVVKVVEKQTIVIEPANPEVIYVPAYNPAVVYGTWWYPDYPPYVYYPPAYVVAAPFFLFATGVFVGAALWGSWDWHHHRCYVNINRYNRFTRRSYNDYHRYNYNPKFKNPNWQHRPEHRKAVPYRDNLTAQRYGQTRPATLDRTRNYRGFDQTGGTRPDPTKFQKELATRSQTMGKPRPGTPSIPGKVPQPTPPTVDRPRPGTPSIPGKVPQPTPPTVDRPRPGTPSISGKVPQPTPPTVDRPRPDAGRAPVVRPPAPSVTPRPDSGKAPIVRPPAPSVTPRYDAGRGGAGTSGAPVFNGIGSGGSERAAGFRGESSRGAPTFSAPPRAPSQPSRSPAGGGSSRGGGTRGGSR